MTLSSPPAVTTTYRLFLRALSASVLHHGPAKRTLRSLFRHPFAEAALAEKKLMHATKIEDAHLRESLQRWLVAWHKQIDSTLELLYSSATNRGVAHRVTRNLGLLANNYYQEKRYGRKKGRLVWDGQHPPQPGKRQPKSDDPFKIIAFNAVGEAIQMAEGHSGVTLGRLQNYNTGSRVKT